jgi:hypothetical protein
MNFHTFFGVDSEHPELNEFVRLNLPSPSSPDDLAFVVLLELDLPAWFELEVVDLESRRKLAFDLLVSDRRLVRNPHCAFFARPKHRFPRNDSDAPYANEHSANSSVPLRRNRVLSWIGGISFPW